MISFIKARPPLIIFSLCILTTAVTLFFFAYFIKNSDLTVDSDRQNEWRELLNHFNILEGCIQRDDNPHFNFDTLVTVQTLVSLNLSDFKQYKSIHGYLSLEGWYTKCPKNNPKPDTMEISFNIPKTDNLGTFDVCVIIKGPKEYLPNFSEPNCLVDNQKVEEEPPGLFQTIIKYKSKDAFCKEGIPTNIRFYPQIKDNMVNFLTNDEKSLIYVHLLWTSYILVFVILLIVIYGIFYNGNHLDDYLKKCTELIHNR